MKKLFEDLATSKIVLIAGSYARGEQTPDSDIDFYIKTPKETRLYGIRNKNIDIVLDILKKHNIAWTSTRNSYISTIGTKNALPIQIEFYDEFYRNAKKLPEVEIMGVKFKTR